MARQKRIYHADTPDIQGEGSYVEFVSPKVGDIRAIQTAEGLKDYELALDLLRNSIREWNWANEDDEPLALPKDSVDDLLSDEVAYLIKLLVSAKEQDLKN